MPYTVKEFWHDLTKEHLGSLTPNERLAGLSHNERLAGLSLNERLGGMSLDELLDAMTLDQLRDFVRKAKQQLARSAAKEASQAEPSPKSQDESK